MPVLIAVVVATLIVTSVLTAVARRGRSGDPAEMRTDPETLATQARRHPAFKRFLLARRDASTATGWLLTIALVGIAVLSLVVGLLLEMVQTRSGFARWDDAAARWGAAHMTGTAERVMRIITQLGSTPVVVAVLVVVSIVEYRRLPTRAIPLFLLTVMAAELAVNNSIKVIVGRERPDIARLVHANGFSFPSGHTAAAAAAYAAIALVIGRRRSRPTQALLAGIAGGITVAVASSRVLLGAHWLTDVIAGAAVGWACFALCSIAYGGRLLHFGEPVEAAQTAAIVAEGV
ncbi:MAG TPA: phosphatase PAP2 family protein [Ilumatobacteraceae bacterium]|nr:phosphatase PAP2 family protein [Ilumatobacteraceae bacterium]HRB01797.1 phosphatase PAP2 family protein [Ilumatobacteraceae bacterium]